MFTIGPCSLQSLGFSSRQVSVSGGSSNAVPSAYTFVQVFLGQNASSAADLTAASTAFSKANPDLKVLSVNFDPNPGVYTFTVASNTPGATVDTLQSELDAVSTQLAQNLSAALKNSASVAVASAPVTPSSFAYVHIHAPPDSGLTACPSLASVQSSFSAAGNDVVVSACSFNVKSGIFTYTVTSATQSPSQLQNAATSSLSRFIMLDC